MCHDYLGLSGVAAEENYRHLSRHTSQQYESIAMTLLSKMFSAYVTSTVEIDSQIGKNCIEFDGFSSYVYSLYICIHQKIVLQFCLRIG